MNKNFDNVKVDLHMHTTASDGTWKPSQLVDKIIEAGIGLFAVTDHDNTQNLAETAVIAREKNLMFIPGVEINVSYKEKNYHILGLGINAENKELQKLLKRNRDLMTDLDYKCIKLIEKKYTNISKEGYDSYVNPDERGGWKSLNYFIDEGLCSSYKDFQKLFDNGTTSFGRIEFPSPNEAINAISMAGGAAILAHPGAEFYDKDYKSIISVMLAEGIKGIECFHPNNSPEITEYCLKICKENNLLITGGSDCHGDYLPNRCLGLPNIELSQLKLDDITILS